MAGPSCSVLASMPCSPERLIEELVTLTASSREKDWLSIADTRAIGGTYEGEGRPFIWFHESRDADDLRTIAEILRIEPQQEIGLAAMCSQAVDHQILGEIALWLAEKTAGFVDLGGYEDLIPPGIPGTVARVPYDTAAGWTAECMVLDRTAMHAWLASPAFRMVK